MGLRDCDTEQQNKEDRKMSSKTKTNVKKQGKNKKVLGQAARLKKIVGTTKWVVGIGVVLLIATLVCSFVMTSVQSDQLEVTMALNQYRLGSKTLSSSVQSYSVTGDEIYHQQYNKELNEDKNRENALEVLKSMDISSEEWVKLNEIVGLSDAMVPYEELAIKDVESGQLDKAQESVFGAKYENTITRIDELTEQVTDEIETRYANKRMIIMVIQLLSQLAFVVSCGYIIINILQTIKFAKLELLEPIVKVSKDMDALAHGDFSTKLDIKEDNTEVGRMVTSINFMKKNMHLMITEISGTLEKMGNGDYMYEIETEYVGEFSAIKDSFITIGEKMRETLHTLRLVTEQIDSGAEQLAGAAQDLADGSSEQTNQVAELVGVMEQMSRSIEENAVAAKDSVELAQNAGKALMVGNEKMEELKEAITEINRCSEQINTIINAIEDIASQTNLLSLNAAIEAARAGEAGRGFAVVAEQVKNLAEESASAAGKTTELIQTTIEAVERGIRMTDETVESMVEVMQGAMQATEKMSQIAVMLDNDVQNVHKVNETIAQVSSIVDNNSATSEETAAVSEEQKAQVETMVQMMDFFKVE